MAEAAAAAAEPFACGQEEGSSRRSSGSEGEIPMAFATVSCLNQAPTPPGSDGINEMLQPSRDEADELQHESPSSAGATDDQDRADGESDDDGQVKVTLEDILQQLNEEQDDQEETRLCSSHADQELQALARTFSQLSFDSDRARDEAHERWWREHESDQSSGDEHPWSEDEAKCDFDSGIEADGELQSDALTLDEADNGMHPPIAGSPLCSCVRVDDERVVSAEQDNQALLPKSEDQCDLDPVDPAADVCLPTNEIPDTNETVIEFIDDPLTGFSNLDIFGHEPLEDSSDDTGSVQEVSSASNHSTESDSADEEEGSLSSSKQMLGLTVANSCPEVVEAHFQERMELSQGSDYLDMHNDDSADWVDVPNQVDISSSASIRSMAEKEEEPHPESPVNSPKLLDDSKSFSVPVEMTHSFEDARLSTEKMITDHQHQEEEKYLSCQANHAIGPDNLDNCGGCQLHQPMEIQQLREHLGGMTKRIVYLTTLLRDPPTLDKWKEMTDSDASEGSWNFLMRMSSETTAEFSDDSIVNEHCDTCSMNMSDACFRLVCDRKAGVRVEYVSSDEDYHEQLAQLTEQNVALKKQIDELQERERAMESENSDLVSTIERLKLQLAKFERPLDPVKIIKSEERVEPDTFNTLFLGHQDFEDDMNSKSTSEWISALLKPDAVRDSCYNENPETPESQLEWLNSRVMTDTCDLNPGEIALTHMIERRNTDRAGVRDDVDVMQPLPFSNQNEPIQWLNLDNAHILVNHERCQERRRELVDTVKILRGYVDAFRSQRDDMKRQRDDAIVSAEKAWDENAKLVGSTNAKQKIQYMMQMKNDNVMLHSRVRELQTKIASQVTLSSSSAILDSDHQDESVEESTRRLCVGDLDDSKDPDRLVLFHRMQAFMEQREAKIQQLKKQRLALSCSQSERSPSSPSFSPAASARRRPASLRIRS